MTTALLVLLAPSVGANVRETQADVKERLGVGSTTNLTLYDKLTRPTLALAQQYTGSSTDCPAAPAEKVSHQFYVDFIAVNQKDLDYTLEGYFRAYWKDERLKWDGPEDGGCVSQLIFNDESQIWVPDFYYEKAKSIELGKKGYGTMLTVQPDGSVFWSRQSSVELRCSMYFGNIPFDTQRCTYTLGMYSQTAAEVYLTWKNFSSTETAGLKNWDKLSTAVWSVDEEIHEDDLQQYSSGNYTYATATLVLKRKAQGYVISYLMLSVFFVAMSYAGFWINPAATPGRVALAVITVLVVSNLSAAAKRDLPPFAYNTWLTDFMFISLLFNLIGFFEMVAVNFGMTINAKCEKLEAERKAKAASSGIQMSAEPGADGGDPDEAPEKKASGPVSVLNISPVLLPRPSNSTFEKIVKLVRMMKDLDYYMRYIFPVAYFIFLVVWICLVGTYSL